MHIYCGEKGTAVRFKIKQLVMAALFSIITSASATEENMPLATISLKEEDEIILKQAAMTADSIKAQAEEAFQGVDLTGAASLTTEDYQCFNEAKTKSQEYALEAVEQQVEIKDQSRLIVFVSFSMPEVSLKQWIQQASRAGATVAVRGLHEESLGKTMSKITDLVASAKRGGVAIDPVGFQTFGITEVPSVVLTDPVSPVSPLDGAPGFDVVVGNGGLYAALERLKASPERGVDADVWLSKLQGAK